MVNKGCDNCYYEYFDAKAYPCSLCIRGIERTDKWMPSKKTKTEIQNYCDDCLYTDTCDSKEFFYACTSKATKTAKAEPQTEKTDRIPFDPSVEMSIEQMIEARLAQAERNE